MGDANDDRAKAAKLPDGDLIAILLTQHAEVKDLMTEIAAASGDERKDLFSTLVTTLKAHETAEESVVRPVTEEIVGAAVAAARNAEEAEADDVIAALSKLDVDSAEFDAQFATFTKAVSEHAEAEETQEFSAIQAERSDDDRQMLGKEFLAQFEAAGGI
jgi:hemerythrin superfamily protein